MKNNTLDNRAITGVNSFTLKRGNWAPHAYKMLDSLIKNLSNNQGKTAYAVFDWDNTCMFMDAEEALFMYQIDNLRFKLAPQEFESVIRKDIPPKNFSKAFNNTAGEEVNIDKVSTDLMYDYTYLYNNYEGLKGSMSLDEIRKTEEFRDFRAKLYYTYAAISESFGIEVGYSWVLYLFANMSSEEVAMLTEEAIDYNSNLELEKHILTSSEKITGKAGIVSIDFVSGIRIVSEMVDLINVLMNNGVDVYICSASFEDVIRTLAFKPKYGYSVPESNVIAMKLEKNTEGKFMPEYKNNYPKTVKSGKTEAIKQVLVKRYGCGPAFVAGDSVGDYNMMVDFSDTTLVLLINRLKGSPMKELSQLAVSTMESDSAKYILQGRDENTGEFIPTEKTVKLGETSERLF